MQDPTITKIAEQRAAILTALASIDDADWNRPTVCEGWSVKDVLGHLVEGELGVGRIYRREVTEQGFVDPHEGVERWRALPGPAVRAAFWQHGIATQRALDAMTPDLWRAPIKAYGCREMRQLVRLHLFDAAVHGHDLTDALGIDALWGPVLDFLVEFVVRAAPPTLARRKLDPTGRLLIAVSDLGRSWLLVGDGDSWTVSPAEEHADAPARVTIDAESLTLVTTGRHGEDALGGAVIDGDAPVAERIMEAWRVV